jgi:Protein of unknown function (DUF664)
MSTTPVTTEYAPTAEHDMLVRWLDAQRRHVLGILEDLDEADLRRPLLPSGWTCLGLVAHLTWDVERFWFQACVAGDTSVLGVRDDAWQVGRDESAEAVFEAYRTAGERANAVIRGLPLDAPPAWWPDYFADYRLRDLREVILHVVAETACHAGHLDAARELVDGRQWLDLTGVDGD